MKLAFKFLFWSFMCWLDNAINHPLWDLISGDKKVHDYDVWFYEFCQWSHGNWSNTLNKMIEEYKWVEHIQKELIDDDDE